MLMVAIAVAPSGRPASAISYSLTGRVDVDEGVIGVGQLGSARAAANAAPPRRRRRWSMSAGAGLVEHTVADQSGPVAGDRLGLAGRLELVGRACSAWGRRSSGPTAGRSCTRAASGRHRSGPGRRRPSSARWTASGSLPSTCSPGIP